MIVIEGPEGLRELAGQELPPTPWLEIDQARIDAFAAATDDQQWIHTDVEHARETPFGGTIAHGYLTLSLQAYFWNSVADTRGFAMVVNYGSNRVRFPSPVPSGSRVRARFRLQDIAEVSGALQLTSVMTVEREGSDKPVCVAETVTRYYV